jgi:hypothetical protein
MPDGNRPGKNMVWHYSYKQQYELSLASSVLLAAGLGTIKKAPADQGPAKAYNLFVWAWRDLNPRPIDYESTALTTELQARKLFSFQI